MAYKVFANGFPLTASELNTYLMNQSVMVFTDSTARSAALTSPTEGMITYLENNNKAQYYDGAAWQDLTVDASAFIAKSVVTTTGDLIVANGNASVTRLGIGTNGQVLQSNGTTATWATPTAGGMTLIASASLVGVSQANITGISGSYRSLNLRVNNLRFSGATMTFAMELNGSTASNYRQSWLVNNNASVQNSTGSANWYLGFSPANVNSNFNFWFPNYTESSKPKLMNYQYGVDDANNNMAGFATWNDNGAITAIRFYNPGGSNFTTGSYQLFGVQ